MGYLTTKEFAAEIGVTERSVREWIRIGRIPRQLRYKVRYWRIDPSAIDLIKKQK